MALWKKKLILFCIEIIGIITITDVVIFHGSAGKYLFRARENDSNNYNIIIIIAAMN